MIVQIASVRPLHVAKKKDAGQVRRLGQVKVQRKAFRGRNDLTR